MGAVKKLDIAVSEAMAVEFEQAIAAGDYVDEADIVAEALSRWSADRSQQITHLREAWEAGIASGPARVVTDAWFDDIKRRGREISQASRNPA